MEAARLTREWGANVVADKHGALSVQNIVHGDVHDAVQERNGVAAEVNPKLRLRDPGNYRTIGFFHTHPYATGFTGISLSGADGAFISHIANKNIDFIADQSGDAQFLLLKTAQTPPNLDGNALQDEVTKRTHQLVAQDQSFSAASSQAAVEMAAKYHFAYYEGAHGALERKYP
jgi:hypothetical protein